MSLNLQKLHLDLNTHMKNRFELRFNDCSKIISIISKFKKIEVIQENGLFRVNHLKK